MRKIYFSICLLVLSFASNAQSFRTPAFTGALSDFTAAEQFAAAANNTTYAITFDATYMYFGAFRTAGSFGDNDNFTIYLDTDPRSTPASGNGTTAGRLFNGFTPTLPFNADYTSITQQNYTDPINRFNGGWASTGVTPTVNVGGTGSNFREVRIALADIGNPASVYVSLYMGYAGGIYSNAPGTTNEGNGATRTMTGFFGSFPVYKAGVTPVTFRAQNTSAANGGGTAISNLLVTGTGTITAGDYGDITLSGAAAVVGTLLGNTSFSGTLTLGTGFANRLNLGGFTMFSGGRGIGGTAGQTTIGSTSGNPIFSTVSSGGYNFLGAGVVNGAGPKMFGNTANLVNISIGGTVDFTGATLFNGGGLQINSGGSMSTPLTFQAGYALTYNTGGTYVAGNEWATNVTTLIPTTVTLQNNTALNFGASTAYRRANGLVTIGSGSSLTLSSTAGGDLIIVAGLTNNNTGTGVGLNTNGRAVENRGTGTYTKAGTDNLDFLIIGTANTLTLASGTNLNLTNTSAAGCLQFNNATGSIFMAGTNTVTIPAGGTVGGTTAGSFGGSGPTTSILNLVGACNWNPVGVITSSINVGIQVNAGLSIATAGRLVAGYVQINQGGFVSTNPVVYVANSTLVYNHSTGSYGVGANEWPATTGPYNVTVTALGGGINFGTNNIGTRTIPTTGINGTLLLNQSINLNGTGTPTLIVNGTAALTGGVVANSAATIFGGGAFTLGSGANFTTANANGVNGTLVNTGTKTFGTTNIFAFNGNVSQVTGALMPTSIGQLIIANTAGGTNGVTISNNTLAISGNTTLTSGALILPTAAGNLVSFNNINSPLSGGTLTGSNTSNILTAGTVGGAAATLVFTSGSNSLNNWTHQTTTFGSNAITGLASVVTINGTFTLSASGLPDFYTTATGGLIIVSGATYTDNNANNDRILGAGSFNVQSGANFLTGNQGGLNASSTTAGAIQSSGTRTFSGGANYTFNNTNAANQAIGDALDGTAGVGKTGPITGNILIANNSASPGVTLNAGTTIIVNSPGTFNIGVSATSSSILTAPALSIINGTGTINMFGNGATNGSTLRTAHANGVNGTFQTTTTNLTNAGNNNTNFTFNGAALAQVTGTFMPATVGSLVCANTSASSAASPALLLSNNTVVSGTLGMTDGHFSINGQTLTANGAINIIAGTGVNTLCGTASSNFIVGGSGVISGSQLVAFAPGNAFNNFTMNRSGSTLTVGAGITVGGTLSLLNGIVALNFTNTFNGPITITSGTVTATAGPLVIGGSGTISGSLTSLTPPLTFTSITMNRTGETLTLGSNTTVSNATGLTLTAGNIALGAFNLTNTNNAGTLGTGSTGSHVVAIGTGKAFMSYPIGATAIRTFPIGDGTNYSPASLTFTANTVAGTVGVNVTDATHPQYDNSGAQTDYLSRYWSFTTTGLTNYTYNSTFTYVPADINGTESLIKLNRWNATAWTEDATSSAASNVLTSTTGLTQATGTLNANDFTGRHEILAANYIWIGTTSNDWATATNWSPTGIPAALDNVTINVPGSNTNCTINSGTKSVATLTLNGTGTLAMLSTTSLTVTGAVTYGGSATANFDCASTFIMNSAASQAVAPLNYGNLNLTGGARVLSNGTSMGVCGTFTPGAGAYTITGSTIDFNGAAAQTIPVFNYNNLTSSNTGARTLPAGTVGIAGAFTPGSNAYTTTGNTVNFNGTSTQSVAAFSSYNNLTISGARGAATVTLASGTIGVAGAFAPTATAVTYTSTGNTFDYTSAAAQTIVGFNKYNNLSNSGNGARTLQSTPTIVIDGTYTPTTAAVTVGTSTIDFSSAATQPMPATFYYNVTNTGNGPRTWANSGIIDINNSFAPTTGTSTITGSTLRYSSTATGVYLMTSFPTNIVGKQYNNLILVGSVNTGWELASGFNLGVAGNFSGAGNGDFTVCNNTTPNTMTVDGDFNMSNDFYVYISANTAIGTLNVTGNLTNSGTGILTGTFFSGAGNLNLTGNMVFNGAAPCKVNLTNDASAPNTVFNIGGNLTIGGSASINMEPVSTSTGSGKIIVAGNFTATSTSNSLIDWGSGLVSANLAGNTVTISGDFLKSGTGQFTTAGGTGAGVIPNFGFFFNKSGTQTFNYTGTASSYTSYTINTGSTLQLLADFAMGNAIITPPQTFNINGVYDMQTFKMTGMGASAAYSILNLNAGGTIKTANPLGLNDGTANSSLGGLNLTATKNYSTTANYEFNAVAAQNTNFPTAITTMNNLTINNSAADVKINKSININGNVIMTSGNLDLNGSNNITLGGSSSIVTETAAKAIINTVAPTAGNGFIGGIFTLAANPGNVANLGMDITTATAMGSSILQRFPKVVSGIPTSLNSVRRVYSIQPTTTSSNSVINFSYFDNELNGNSETVPALVVYSSNGANETVAAGYIFNGATAVNTTSNTVTQTTNITTTNTFHTLVNDGRYITVQAGDWNTTTTWLGGNIPPANSSAVVRHAVTVNAAVLDAPNVVTQTVGGSLTFGAAGNLTVNNTFTNGGSGVIMTAGGTLNLSNNATLANGTNTFTGGTGTVVFAGVGTVSGTIVFNNITANGGLDLAALTTTINGAFTLNAGAYVNPDAPSYGSSSTLIYNSGGTYDRNVEWGSLSAQGYPNNIIIQNGTTVNMNTNALAANYGLAGNLKLGNATSAGNLDMNNAVRTLTVGGNVEIGDATGTSTLTLSSAVGGDLYIKGNWIRNANGVFNPTGRAVFINGAGPQTLTGATTFDYLLMSQAPASTLTLNNNINIVQLLTFGTGKIVTAGNIVIMNSTSSATGASATSYVNGTQQYDVAAPVTRTFNVGDASVYAPVTSVFTGVTAGGALKVSTTAGDHANILTSAIDENKTANRTWTLAEVAGLVGTHNTTFNFVAGDLDGTATPANFVVGNYNASWTYPTVGVKTAVSTQANNVNTFGDFQLGECRGVTVIITNPAIVCSPATVDITLAAITTGSTLGLTYTYFTDAAATVTYATPTAATSNTYYIKGTSASGCFDIKPITVIVSTGSTWTGAVDGNWNNAANWLCGSPSSSSDVFIPIVASGIYPNITVATTPLPSINNLTIAAAGASTPIITVGTGATLNLYGTTSGAGAIDATLGTINMVGGSAVLNGANLTTNTVNTIKISGSATIASGATPVKVTSQIDFVTASNVFTTNDNLVLVSSATETASMGNVNGGTIVGKVEIQRYLSGIKAWRLLATPIVVDPAGQTITDSWREGGLDLTTTGFGTRVTGADGPFLTYGPTYTGAYLDEYTIRSNMKSYNMSSNNFTDVLGIDIQTNKKIANNDGYFLFVRGDRTSPAVVAGAGTSTTLRMKGEIRTGNQLFGVDPLKFRSIGNPFPSRIDMRDVYLGAIKLQSFYVWNPSGVGGFNAGQYVGYTFTGTNFTNGAAVLNYIESGQAFFVQNNDAGALSLVIKETDKTTGSANVSRGNATSPTLEINLHSIDTNGTEFLADGAMLNFDNAYNNGIDNYDVKKITNSFDNVAIKSNGTSLLVERKTALVVTDSIHLNISNMRTANYKFEIDPSLLVYPELTAYLKDRFLQTETEVSLTSITNINFATTTDAASKAANRFVIFFRPSGVLPVTFVDIAAIKNANKTHTVKWSVANELNIQQYEVERSSNGSNFVSIGSTAASQQSDYNLDDATPLAAINFYRVKAVSQNGQVQYSAIVKLNADVKDASIALNTNPVNNGQIVLGFYNQRVGQYQVAIYNNLGQLIKSEKVIITGNTYLKTINIDNNFKGNGHIVITNLDGDKKTISFVSY